MRNKQKKSLAGFTLVELIVVITILVILGAIAFTSLSGYSGNARDSSRASDISNLAKGLDISYAKTSAYPSPDNTFAITYSGGVLWNQGMIGDSVIRILAGGGARLSKKPTDPLNKEKQYTYSKLQFGNAYQLKSDWEGDSVAYLGNPLFINTTYAATGKPTLSYIKGNYAGLAAKTETGATTCIVALPSIISNTGTSATPTISIESSNLLSGSLLTQGGNLDGTPFKSSLSGTGTPIVYCSGALPSTNAEKLDFAIKLATAYSGTVFENNPQVKPLTTALKTGDNTTLTKIGGAALTNNLGGGSVENNDGGGDSGGNCIFGTSTFDNCTFAP